MTKKILGMALAIVLVWALPSLASTITGPTGLFNIPSADVNAPSVIGASVHVSDNNVVAALNYSLMDFLEIGASSRSGKYGARFSAFVKGQIFRETANDPGLAAGFEDDSAFVVFSKTLAPLFRGHLGMGTGRFNGLFGGVSYLVNPVVVTRPSSLQMPRVMLIAEYDGRKPNVGTRLSFAQGLDINVALMNVSDVTIGASWRTRF